MMFHLMFIYNSKNVYPIPAEDRIFTWQTSAYRSCSIHSTVGIGTTGGGDAGIHWLWWDHREGGQGALDEGVSHVSLVTLAYWVVVLD